MAILMLAVPALCSTFLTTHLLGASRSSVLPSSGIALWREGWAVLAAVVVLTLMILPWIRALGLVTVLSIVRGKKRPVWLAGVFRLTQQLDPWAMLDVCLLALIVAYGRLRASIAVDLGPGAIVIASIALLTLLSRYCLSESAVWERVRPSPSADDLASATACSECGWLTRSAPRPSNCPRCGIVDKRPNLTLTFTSQSMLTAAVLLYAPANLYPIATLPVDLKPQTYTVLGGAIELARSHLMSLACLVVVASFLIPLLKFIGLTWCIASVQHRSRQHLIAKTRVHWLLKVIGRWSMVDPLAIACFVPVLQYSGLAAKAEAAAVPFALVVLLTILAVERFDPRNLWHGVKQS